mgnify:CR=1 FL=1
MKKDKIAVIIPCFKVKNKINYVVKKCLKYFDAIICVDDCCPQKSGLYIKKKFKRFRKVKVLFNKKNMGVGGAVKTGYKFVLKKNYKFIVKLDGDGQMDPGDYKKLIYPIKKGNALYTKGNRFFYQNYFKKSPKIRYFGNLILTIVSKFTTGYWGISDPLNGYTCIEMNTLRKLNFSQARNDFFFETSMIFLLKNLNIKIEDVKVKISYGGEISNFKIYNELSRFIYLHFKYFLMRIFK